jgi:coenzyme F420 biosynthesis associated uncharacterized protein
VNRRTSLDPRLIALGLLTGAAVGVWAGRRAQTLADRPVRPQLIDWDRAREIAVNMNHEAALSATDRRRLDEEYGRLVDQTIPVVSAFTGLTLPSDRSSVFAFDRVDWINSNIESFKVMFQPIERLRLVDLGNSPRVINVLWSGLNQAVISAELGILLGYLARRVLGQYDLSLLGREPMESTGKLYFVQPNIANMERTLGVPSQQFRLWLALHETTHAFEFEAVPWLRGHMNGMLEEYFGFITQDIDYLKRGLDGLKVFVERARERGSEQTSWIELVMTPEQRRLFARMQATMSIVEGYSNYVMNGVGRDLLPSYEMIHTRFERRQRDRTPAEKLFIRLTGLDLKMEQYRLGEAFINRVVESRGHAFAQRVWSSADALPTMAELRQPELWIERMTTGAMATGAA